MQCASSKTMVQIFVQFCPSHLVEPVSAHCMPVKILDTHFKKGALVAVSTAIKASLVLE